MPAQEFPYKKWVCLVCGWIYDEAKGDSKEGFAPGTRWEDIPEDWVCPDCGVGKQDFIMVEITQAQAPIRVREKFSQPIIIVGSGYAGLQQVKALREISDSIPITLICNDNAEVYSKPSLSNALRNGIKPSELVRGNADSIREEYQITLLANTEINAINPLKKCITDTSGKQYPYSKLVLATGAKPLVPNIEGNAASDILKLNHIEDYRLFRRKLSDAISHKANPRILILGNGLIGCELANDLHGFSQASTTAIDIHVVGLSHYPLDPMIPDKAGAFLQENLPVNWAFGCTLESLNREDSTDINAEDTEDVALQATLSDGSNLLVDIVIVAIGLTPNTQLAQQSKLKTQRGILVNDYMQSSNQHIYAIGDCVQAQGMVLPFIAPINHQTKIAAMNMVGHKSVLKYPAMPVKVKTDVPLIVLSPPPKSLINWNVSYSSDGVKATNKGKKGRINGFVLMGNRTEELANILSKTDITN